MKKTIWMCWFQGEDDNSIPELNKKCIKRWKELNSDYEVNVLCNNTIKQYVPEFFEFTSIRKPAAKSDLLRILLLSKYGGVWVDASVYPMLPLSDFYENVMNDTGFFAYRFLPRLLNRKKGDREIVSWFLCVDVPHHSLIESWKTAFVEKYNNLKKYKYYTFHETLCNLYDSSSHIKFTLDNMVQENARPPLSAEFNWKTREQSYMYKRPKLSDMNLENGK